MLELGKQGHGLHPKWDKKTGPYPVAYERREGELTWLYDIYGNVLSVDGEALEKPAIDPIEILALIITGGGSVANLLSKLGRQAALTAEKQAIKTGAVKEVGVISKVRQGLGKLIGNKIEEAAPTSSQIVAGREVFQAAKNAFSNAKLAPAQKANALEQVFKHINDADKSWSATRGSVVNGEALFVGDQMPFGLLVDAKGSLWVSRNIAASGEFKIYDGVLKYLADFSKWSPVK